MGILDVTHDAFARMRLADYLAADEIVQLEGWEYLYRDWLGEASGFTEWLRLESDPDQLCSVAIDLDALHGSTSTAMLVDLRLPLRPGMTLEGITAALGAPVGWERLLPDRATLEFEVDTVDPYLVACTVHEEQGLIYLTIHATPLPE